MSLGSMQVELEGLEASIYEGEMVRIVARMQNTGSLPLQALKLLVEQPDLLCCQSPRLLLSRLSSLAGEAKLTV